MKIEFLFSLAKWVLKHEKSGGVKLVVNVAICSVLRLVFICMITGTLGSMDITFSNWQFWAIFCSAIGLYICGMGLGKAIL